MLRLSLALILLVTQSSQAFAVPIYLCVAPDGSLAVDLGPKSCQCRKDAHDDHDATGDEDAVAGCGCHGGQAAHHVAVTDVGLIDGGSIGEPACDCTHVPVSCSAAQVLSRPRGTVRVSAAWNAGCLPLPAHSPSLVTALAIQQCLSPAPDDSGGAISLLKTIILRC